MKNIMAYLDQREIANFLAQELFYQQFITLEGLNSGVPTRTTPTLTPTTLRNIEQTFIELQSKPETHENEAGFVPPLVHSIGNNQYISASDADLFKSTTASITPPPMWQHHSTLSQSSSDSNTRTPPPAPLSQKTSLVNNSTPSRRNMGGRKPAKDINVSPEEEERRRVRRERNKAAAARCRKRRVDHTNSLVEEVEALEMKKQQLQDEYQELINEQDQLQFFLDSHRKSGNCRLHSSSPPDVKPAVFNSQQQHHHHHQQQHNGYANNNSSRVKTEIIDLNDDFPLPSPAKRIMLSSTVPIISKPSRPNSLNVMGATAPNSGKQHHPQNDSELAGIPITTPSSGIQFNFDSLMVGGTGLTPVSAPLVPSCSTQQRNVPVSAADLTSPDAKLVSL